MKNNYFKYAFTLTLICLIASGLLAVIFNLTHPKIIEQELRQEQESLKDVFNSADSFEPVREGDNILYYKALDKDKNILGYAFKSSKKGYSSEVVTMAGMTKDGVISNIKILSQNETPGLGSRVTEIIQKNTLWDILFRKMKVDSTVKPWFQEQFSGKKAGELLGTVDVITGATITSRAVIDSVQEKAKEIMEKSNLLLA